MKLHYLEETQSTNNFVKENIELLSDQTVVYTKKQTAGRGRFNRKWIFVGENNLYLTLVLKPIEKYHYILPNFTQYAALSLAKTFEKYGVKPEIKWPNDILIKGKKISGILAETVIKAGSFRGLALGIGINLNASEKDFENINKAVTALNLELEHSIDVQEFFNELLAEFFTDYEKFLSNGFEFIKDNYTSHCKFLGKEITVQNLTEKLCGTAKEISDIGTLIIEVDGKFQEITAGDIDLPNKI